MEWDTLCIKFEKMLTDEKFKIFHKLCGIQSAAAADDMSVAYKAGFKEGVTMVT